MDLFYCTITEINCVNIKCSSPGMHAYMIVSEFIIISEKFGSWNSR